MRWVILTGSGNVGCTGRIDSIRSSWYGRTSPVRIERSAAVLFFCLLVCFFFLGETRAEVECTHPSLPEGLAAMASTDRVSVETREVTVWPGTTEPASAEDNRYFLFEPRNRFPTTGLIVHPGGNCDPRAYAPMAQAIASAGYLVAIIPMPNCISIFAPDRTAQVIEDRPSITRWVLAGHSVGGASICQYAYEHGGVAGLVMLAGLGHDGYPLDETHNVKVLSLYGEKDTHLTPEMIMGRADSLPADTVYVELAGANHTQFGWLDPTPHPEYFDGDGPADISYQEQQDLVVEHILDFLRSFDDTTSCPVVSLLGEHAPQVMSLRQFRDQMLVNSSAGKKIIGYYYLHAAAITDVLDNHALARGAAKQVLRLLTPILNTALEANL